MPRRSDDDDDEWEPPRRRSRNFADDDDPPPRRRRRRRRPQSRVPVIAIAGTVVGSVLLVALLVAVSGGRRGGGGGGVGLPGGGLFGAAVTYRDFAAMRVDRAEWGRPLRVGAESVRNAGSLAAHSFGVDEIEAWYRWRSGSEDVYVAVGTGSDGRRGLVVKGYTNIDAMRQNAGKAHLKNIDPREIVPAYEFQPID